MSNDKTSSRESLGLILIRVEGTGPFGFMDIGPYETPGDATSVLKENGWDEKDEGVWVKHLGGVELKAKLNILHIFDPKELP